MTTHRRSDTTHSWHGKQVGKLQVNTGDPMVIQDTMYQAGMLRSYLVRSEDAPSSNPMIDDVTLRQVSKWMLYHYSQMSRDDVSYEYAMDGIILACVVKAVSTHHDLSDLHSRAFHMGEFCSLLAEAILCQGEAAGMHKVSSNRLNFRWSQSQQDDFYHQLDDMVDLIEAIAPVCDKQQAGWGCFIEDISVHYTVAFFSQMPRGSIDAVNTSILVHAAHEFIRQHMY